MTSIIWWHRTGFHYSQWGLPCTCKSLNRLAADARKPCCNLHLKTSLAAGGRPMCCAPCIYALNSAAMAARSRRAVVPLFHALKASCSVPATLSTVATHDAIIRPHCVRFIWSCLLCPLHTDKLVGTLEKPRRVFAVDMRNHGASSHHDSMTYPQMVRAPLHSSAALHECIDASLIVFTDSSGAVACSYQCPVCKCEQV